MPKCTRPRETVLGTRWSLQPVTARNIMPEMARELLLQGRQPVA